MFAAGCVEGWLTNRHVRDWRYNFGAALFGEDKKDDPIPSKLQAWLEDQYQWAQAQVKAAAAAPTGDPRWRHVGLVFKQLEGLLAGCAWWSDGGAPGLAMIDLLLIQAAGDTDDLMVFLCV